MFSYLKNKFEKHIFCFRDLDVHYVAIFFGKIQISFRHKNKFKYTPAFEYGLNKDKRTPELIISLTSYPDRIPYIHKTINTLLNQSLKPDRLILWLADSQFPNKEKDLPQNLLKLIDLGLEIKWCEDLRSYKKLIPALKEFPNDIIVTADDDLYYTPDWLESLYSEYLKNPNQIYTRRACGINLKDNIIKINPHYANNNYKPTFLNQLMGGAGTLYPPNTLNKDIFNTEQIKNLIPTHDDIYFWAMAVLKNTKIQLIKNKDVSFYVVKGTEQTGLCKDNSGTKTTGMSPKEAFKRILEKYPEIYEKLERESI